MTYYTQTGDIVSADQIKTAVANGTARIIYSHNPDGGLYHSLNLNSPDIDTRGECYQAAEERWSIIPTLDEALEAAHA